MPNGSYQCQFHTGFDERIRNNTKGVRRLDENMSALRDIIGKMYVAFIAASLTFAAAAIMLGLNLALS